MSKDFFRVKKGLNIQPTDPSGVSDLENGDIIIDSTDANKLKQYNADAGVLEEIKGSGGGINYLDGTNSDAEASVGDWVEYADAAGENPVDGTGGTANITFTRNTTSPLRGNADFKLSKDAVNRQGEGASVDFTIDAADQAQKLTISFDYDTSNTNYADNDLRVAIYDVTNASLIRVNGEDLKGGKGTHYAQFQTASDSTSYRLILHVSSTNAAAYDVFLDNVKVGPTDIGIGTNGEIVVSGAGNDGSSYTADTPINWTETKDTTSSFDGTTFTAPESGNYSISGVANFTTAIGGTISLYIDGVESLGISTNTSVSRKHFASTIFLNKGEQLTIRINVSATLNNDVTTHWIHIQKIGDSSEARATVGGGREVVVRGAGNSGAAITQNTERIDFTVIEDTTSSWSQVDGNGTDTFTAPETGYYAVSGCVRLNAADNNFVIAYIDTVEFGPIGNSRGSSALKSFSGHIYLEKGQELSLRLGLTATLLNSTTDHRIHIQKLASPQTILETETVAARYTSNSNQTINGTPSTYVYEDLDYDTHNAYNTSTGEYTVPISGKYMISAHTWMSINANTVGELRIRKNGSAIKHVRNVQAVSGGISVEITDFADFSKGDVIDITAYTNSGSSSSSNTEEKAVFSIAKIK